MRNFKIQILAFILLFSAVCTGDITNTVKNRIYRFVKSGTDADSVSVFVDKLPSVKNSAQIKFVAVEWKKGKAQLRGRVVIPVRIVFQDNSSEIVYVNTEISLFKRVPVAEMNMNRNKPLHYSDFKMELRDITALRTEPAEPEDLYSGVRTRRVIVRGRIITKDMIESEPVIHRGDRVKVLAKSSNLLVTTYAIAKQDGWKGKRIRVRTLGSRKEIYALVTGPSVVEIIL